MTAYFVRRLLLLPVVILGVVTVTFLLLQLTPGCPAALVAGADAPPHVVERIEAEMGLDRPIWEQYLVHLSRVFRGDFGRSLLTRAPVMPDILRTLPNTLILVMTARIWSVMISIPLGIACATRRGSMFDRGAMVGAVFGLSLPIFWIGLAVMWLFAYRLGWFPLSGMARPILSWEGLRHIILPAFSLGITYMAILTRLTRSTMLEVMREDYITTARSKGVRERIIVYRHALKNAMLPIITVIGVQLVRMFGGTVVCETIFAWPGMGRLSVHAVMGNDFPTVQGVVVITGLASVLLNLGVDMMYAALDPRIRYS